MSGNDKYVFINDIFKFIYLSYIVYVTAMWCQFNYYNIVGICVSLLVPN